MILDSLDPHRRHTHAATVAPDSCENEKKVAFDEEVVFEDKYNTALRKYDEEAANDYENHIQETWDEGGRSDCGYSDAIHDTLMSVGKMVHSFFGEPSDEIQVHMRSVGSYFQEASYIARDLSRDTSIEEGDYSYVDLEYGHSDSVDQEASDEQCTIWIHWQLTSRYSKSNCNARDEPTMLVRSR